MKKKSFFFFLFSINNSTTAAAIVTIKVNLRIHNDKNQNVINAKLVKKRKEKENTH